MNLVSNLKIVCIHHTPPEGMFSEKKMAPGCYAYFWKLEDMQEQET